MLSDRSRLVFLEIAAHAPSTPRVFSILSTSLVGALGRLVIPSDPHRTRGSLGSCNLPRRSALVSKQDYDKCCLGSVKFVSHTGWITVLNYCRSTRLLIVRSTHKGQALVEFSLVFILLLVVAWIPADFGLAFYTGQLALNASREGARIAAADPNLLGAVGSCTLTSGDCYSLADGTILKETAKRVSSALMPGATIRVCYPVASVNPVNADGTCNAPVSGSTCNAQLAVTIRGDYNYTFFRVLRYFGTSVPATVQILHATQVRWEHQNSCT